MVYVCICKEHEALSGCGICKASIKDFMIPIAPMKFVSTF